jgi:hypothetical protein
MTVFGNSHLALLLSCTTTITTASTRHTIPVHYIRLRKSLGYTYQPRAYSSLSAPPSTSTFYHTLELSASADDAVKSTFDSNDIDNTSHDSVVETLNTVVSVPSPPTAPLDTDGSLPPRTSNRARNYLRTRKKAEPQDLRRRRSLYDQIHDHALHASIFVPGNVRTLPVLFAIVRETERRWGRIVEFRCPTVRNSNVSSVHSAPRWPFVRSVRFLAVIFLSMRRSLHSSIQYPMTPFIPVTIHHYLLTGPDLVVRSATLEAPACPRCSPPCACTLLFTFLSCGFTLPVHSELQVANWLMLGRLSEPCCPGVESMSSGVILSNGDAVWGQ